MGSLGGLAVFVLLRPALDVLFLMILVALAAGVWACNHVVKEMQAEDPSRLVIDEVVGMWITLLPAPRLWTWWLAAFVLFRLFDIFKPFPIFIIDRRVKGGWGVMLDDVAAGIMGAAALLLLSSWPWLANLMNRVDTFHGQ
jgi:phosphatidylglycerophosphatase A